MVAADSFMASRRAFLGSHILALILVSICLVNWDFNSNLSFPELDQVCMLARYHPHRSFNFFDFNFHTLVEERRHFGSSLYRGGGYLSFRMSLSEFGVYLPAQVSGKIAILRLFSKLIKKTSSPTIMELLYYRYYLKSLRDMSTQDCIIMSRIFLNINQKRLRQHRSCVTQLLQFVHPTAKSLDAGIQTDVIYVDMAKAFNKVPHEKLLYKLEMVGVRGQLLAWFRSYLTNRRHRTVIEGYASDWRYVPSGVPQGSIIGPLLFLIFINDITVNIDADTNMPLYADDAKCFRELLSLDDHDALQKDLYSIEDWSDLYRYVL